MTDATTLETAPAELVPTPNGCALPRRLANFATFAEALDYAASGTRGLNFHDPRGRLTRPYPFSELRADALAMARRLIAQGFQPGDRLALVAETGPEFAALFCGAVYAGVWPVPLPLPTSFGGKDNYIDQLAVQLGSSDPKALFYPAEIAAMAGAAAQRHGCAGQDFTSFAALPAPEVALPTLDPDAICYLQYSSGSTRFPHGVAVTHASLMNNLAGHGEGMHLDVGADDELFTGQPNSVIGNERQGERLLGIPDVHHDFDFRPFHRPHIDAAHVKGQCAVIDMADFAFRAGHRHGLSVLQHLRPGLPRPEPFAHRVGLNCQLIHNSFPWFRCYACVSNPCPANRK